MTTYAILGTGALGGLYGGLLARMGADVHFLMRSDYQFVRSHGLQIDSHYGDFHLDSPNVYASAADMPQADVVVVAWKSTSNTALRETLHQVCKPTSVVVVLQNGLDVERDAADVVGAERVLGGCCFLCCNKIGPGHIKHLDYGRIELGETSPQHAGQITERMLALTEDFRRAGIDMQPVDDLPKVRWKKLAWNIPYNGLSVVLEADTQQIMNDPAARTLVEELMFEVRDAAAACGASFDSAHIQKMLDDTKSMVPYTSSMRLDHLARRPMEVEAIFGNPLRASLAAGFRPQKIEMLYRQLCFVDRRNRSVG